MKNLKLNQVEKSELSKKEMSHCKGGGGTNSCGCGCAWENNGGSSTHDNGMANSLAGVNSKGPWKVIVETTVFERNADEG